MVHRQVLTSDITDRTIVGQNEMGLLSSHQGLDAPATHVGALSTGTSISTGGRFDQLMLLSQ